MCIAGTLADYRFSCIVLAGPPADCPFLHVVFYPDRRLTVQCYKKIISGPPADSSLRVNNICANHNLECLFIELNCKSVGQKVVGTVYHLHNSSLDLFSLGFNSVLDVMENLNGISHCW